MITSKDIQRNNLQWAMVDNFAPHLIDRKPLIVNTDLSSGQGTHWITMIPIDQLLYIIDSLGPKNYRPNDKLMLKIIHEKGFQPQFYQGKFQYSNDSLCGWYAIYVATLLKKYKGNLTPMIANHIVSKVFGKTADKEDIHHLIKAFGISRK